MFHKFCLLYSLQRPQWTSMENGDDWLAIDKLYHVLFCFSISIIFSLLASMTRHPFIRRLSIWIGSIVSFAAGAAKEFADELGFFKSAGASSKDAVADLVGILLAAVVLYLFNCTTIRPDGAGHVRVLDMVWICLTKLLANFSSRFWSMIDQVRFVGFRVRVTPYKFIKS